MNDLGSSARILACPSQGPLFCFLSVGLARKAHELKKVPQGHHKKEKALAFSWGIAEIPFAFF
ncbi:hypothetical protein ORM92_04550 [Bacillus cereus]|uniref:hypothetical protein n=1 Tax=Bacillus cereus TaxID=1396 RepID=UPI002AC2E7C0|nr:hypothetical protein [Bacillus cereus]MDZ4530421.1 hypothetical protein [Bacillus cereus]